MGCSPSDLMLVTSAQMFLLFACFFFFPLFFQYEMLTNILSVFLLLADKQENLSIVYKRFLVLKLIPERREIPVYWQCKILQRETERGRERERETITLFQISSLHKP